mmetsp:Transcript_599/g.1855  ORF Transcript_599/g.1855 Transcript_599/m.1855 type:complete len:216 (+) Transcript_599:394-1041(+)
MQLALSVRLCGRVVAAEAHLLQPVAREGAVVLDPPPLLLAQPPERLAKVSLHVDTAKDGRALRRQPPDVVQRVAPPLQAPPDGARHVQRLRAPVVRHPRRASRPKVVHAALVAECEVQHHVVVEVGEQAGEVLRLALRRLDPADAERLGRDAGGEKAVDRLHAVAEVDVVPRVDPAARAGRDGAAGLGGQPGGGAERRAVEAKHVHVHMCFVPGG